MPPPGDLRTASGDAVTTADDVKFDVAFHGHPVDAGAREDGAVGWRAAWSILCLPTERWTKKSSSPISYRARGRPWPDTVSLRPVCFSDAGHTPSKLRWHDRRTLRSVGRTGVLKDPQRRARGTRAHCGAASRQCRSMRTCRRVAAGHPQMDIGQVERLCREDARAAGSTCGAPLPVAGGAISGNGSSRAQQRRTPDAASVAAWRARAR